MSTPTRPRRKRTGATVDERWDIAIDYILNTGTMYPYMDSFWKYVDGEISREQFEQEMPG